MVMSLLINFARFDIEPFPKLYIHSKADLDS